MQTVLIERVELPPCSECGSTRCPFCAGCHAERICPVSLPPCPEGVAQGLFVGWTYAPGTPLARSFCLHHRTHRCPNKFCPEHESYSCGCYDCDGSAYQPRVLERQRVRVLSYEVATLVDLFPHTDASGMAHFGERREPVVRNGEIWGLRHARTHPTVAFCLLTGDASVETANAIERFLRERCLDAHVAVNEQHFSLDYRYYEHQPFRAFLQQRG